NVKDFVVSNNKIYAVADNAVFIYDKNFDEIEKFSSVHGLSGKTSTAIFYSETTDKFVVGYESGLIEIVDDKGNITIANDIERLDISGLKQVNHISENNGILYLSTPFGIVEYNLADLQFGDTFFIGAGSTEVFVKQTVIFKDRVYAATKNGIYSADINNTALVDFHNWLQPAGIFSGDFEAISTFNEKLYASKDNILYEVVSQSQLEQKKIYSQNIINLKSSGDFISISASDKAYILDINLNERLQAPTTSEFNFTLHTAYAENEDIYLATKEYGVLKRTFFDNNFVEIHPKGPTSNDVFSITAQNEQLWVVYGGYNSVTAPSGLRKGYSHFNGLDESWVNMPYDPDFPAIDLSYITIDPENENKVYFSSMQSGILVVEDDMPVVIWDDSNSGLESIPDYRNFRINGSAFDSQGNFWVANIGVDQRLKKMDTNGNWRGFSLSSIIPSNPPYGLYELIIDKTGSVWIGSRGKGVLVFNENGNRQRALVTETSKGSLPDLNVKTLAVDRNNRIWIGTKKGMVVFSNASGIFDGNIYDARPVIIDDEGIPKKLLGDQSINTIAIDGADNKWFGTDTGGLLNTNSSGSETLHNFNKDNSPLASNRIIKISIDDSTGKVFFATDKGIVAFKSDVAPFGETLTEVYAYPNPVRKDNETVTIDGRKNKDGVQEHLPRGTNVKILDTAGRLVFETNVREGGDSNGGIVVWNKTNLAGRKVASGVYIVLLTSPDKSETAMTKIAIIN
ncbi:MAG: two-component regulator propeller domain-containing protein, partial [Bacteroidota bacterium]